MDSEELEREIADPLSDGDLKKLLGNDIPIIRYPELARAKHIEDIFDKKGRSIILYLTTSSRSGHWQTLWRNKDNSISFFDSYAKKPDQAFDWTTDEQEALLGQTQHHLTRLLRDAVRRGIPVFYNTVKYQKKGGDIATCGRHVAWRLKNRFMPAQKYYDMVMAEGDADEFVTRATEDLLRE